MATAIFDGTGVSAADWSAQDNWTGGTGTGGVPGTNDDVLVGSIPGDVTSNLTAFNGVAIHSFQVTQACTKRLGSATASITFDSIVPASGGQPAVIYGGSGEYCKLAVANNTTKHIGASDKPCLIYPTAGTFFMGTGIWDLVYAAGANVEIASDAVVTTFYGVGSDVRDERNTSTGFTTFEINSGQAVISRDIATANVGRGLLVIKSPAAISTKLNIFADGVCNYQSSGTLTAVEIRPGGSFSPSGAYQNFTITTATVWGGSDFLSQEQGISVTVTNTIYVGPFRPGGSNVGHNAP